MSRLQGWLTSLSAALIALVLVGPPLWGAVSSMVQHREDEAHVSGDPGNELLCVRDDNASGVTGTDNDYAPCITDSVNRMWTRPAWLTSTGSAMEDDTNDALRVSPVTVVTTQGKTSTVKTWHIDDADGAQDLKLVDVTSAKVRVHWAMVSCDADNSVDVKARMFFDSDATAPTESEAGVAGEIAGHSGIAAGSGYVFSPPSAVEGATDEDLYLEMTDPTGGACWVTVAYEVIS